MYKHEYPFSSTPTPNANKNKLVLAAVSIVGVLLMVAVVAILAIVLLTGSIRLQHESFSDYMMRVFTGARAICEADPPTFEMLHSDWDGLTRKRGTSVHYRCGHVNDTPIARAVQCRNTGKWVESFTDLAKCRLDPKNKKRFDEEESAITSIGCTEKDPPPAGRYHRDWNELRWKPGTTIHYYCSEDREAPLVMTVVCASINNNFQWVTKKRFAETCECPMYPPEYETKKHLLNWEPNQRWIGTVVGYRCANVYGSPYEKIYTCNVHKQWEVTEVLNC